MTISLTHKFVSTVPDGTDTSVVRPSNWNDEHAITGTLPVANGGTNVSSTPSNGQLLIGDGTGYTLANLTAGTGVTITNAAGGITISAPDTGTVTAVTASSPIASSGGNTPNISLTGVVPIANGGTNTTATPTAGGVVYGTGTAQAYSGAGTTGYYLQSTGTGAPTWSSGSTYTGSTGYWGSFYSTANQTAASTTSSYTMNLGTGDPANNGVSLTSGTQLTFANAGVYNIAYSVEFKNTSTGIKNYNVDIWLRKNGSDLTNSNSIFDISHAQGGIDGEAVAATMFTLSLNAGDYIEFLWAVSDTEISIATTGAQTTPTVPVTPSIIITASEVAQIGLGYYGLTSTTSQSLATGSKTFTTNLTATQTAFGVGTRVRAAYATTPANYLEGVITAFTGSSMIINVDTVGGSGGPYASWNISVAGNYGTVGGSNTQLQYNNSGALGGISGVTTDGTAITIANGDLKLSGATSGTSVLNAPATGGGTLTLPAGTTTLAGLGTAQTFTAAQTFSAAMTYGGVTLSNSVTGTGSMVLSAGPTFTGTVTIPTPFTLGAVSMTSTGTQLNYLNAATGTTGTTSSNVVFSASPIFTGTVTIPTPFTLGSTSVTATGTQLNYLNAATGTTGTTSSNVVFSASPTFTGTLSSANQTLTSASANALAVGANGTTNPAFNVDASTASVATGLNVKGAAAGGGVTISAISSGTNENLILAGKGTGVISCSTTTVYKTSATVTAGTNAQGQGALTSDLNVITTAANAPSGVTLPTGVLGQRLVIINRGANTVNAYPASGGIIDSLAANASIAIPTTAWMEFIAVSSTQWYSTANMATTALWG